MTNPNGNPDTDALVRKTLTDCRGDTDAALDALASQLKEAREAVLGAHSLGYETGKAEAESKLARVTEAADALADAVEGLKPTFTVTVRGYNLYAPALDAYREAAKEETP